MSYARLAAAAAAATVADAVYGFVVYGTLMVSEFGRYPAIYRPNDVGAAYLPLMLAGIFVAMLAASWIYAKGYEGGAGTAEGLRFGLLLGVFVVGYVAVVNYSILNIGRKLAVMTAAAGFGEWLLAGVVIGVVYRAPAATAARRGAGV